MVEMGPKTTEEMTALVAAVLGEVDYTTEVAVDELAVLVKPDDILSVARLAKDDERLQMDYLRCLSGVDLGDSLQVVYHLFSFAKHHKLVLKTNLTADSAVVPSVVGLWLGADWHERETAEMFGIQFQGHPDPRRLLLSDDLAGNPLLKSFKLGPAGRQE